MTIIESDQTLLWTEGLPVEFELRVPDLSWITDGKRLLSAVASHVEATGSGVRGETFQYGYWILRFEEGASGRNAIWESRYDASGFEAGATLALRYWREQHAVCEAAGISFAPPRPDQMAAVSDGVFDGEPVQAVRYPAPEHMSGWYITTARFDGDMRNLQVEHLYHLTAERPDLARYIAAAPGARFDTTNGEDVWYDIDVAAGI